MDLIKRIEKTQLSPDQKQIVNTITSKLHRTAFLSGPELADECSVSTSAITRLSQKLGYSGFPEMKKDLESLYRKTTTPYEAFESFLQQPTNTSIASKSLGQDLENLKRMHSLLDDKTIANVIHYLDGAKTVYLLGAGSAEALVDLLAAYFDALEKGNQKLKGFGLSKMAELVDFDKADVVVAFSFQRIVKEVRDVVARTRQAGCKTIAITDSATNPLSEAADKILITPVTGTTFGLSLTAPLAMVNLLANSLAAHNPKKSLRSLKKAKEQWEKYPIFCK